MSYYTIVVDGRETTSEGNTFNEAVINAALENVDDQVYDEVVDNYEGF